MSQNNSDFYLAWGELFNVLPRPSVVVNEDLLRQKLSFKLLQLLIIENNISQIEIFPLSEEILTDRERNIVLRYVAGYIPHSINKRFEECKASSQRDCLKLISSLSKKGEGQFFLQSSNKWIDCSNRGGLFEISDQTFIFFRSMEYVVRKIFNVELLSNYKGENLKDVLLQRMLKNKRIINYWDEVSKNVNVEEKIKIFVLKEIMICWINICGTSFVKAWLDCKNWKRKCVPKKESTLFEKSFQVE